MSRDDNDRAQVERIIAAQMPREDRLRAAGNVIDNDQPLERVREEVAGLHQHLLAMAAEVSGDTLS